MWMRELSIFHLINRKILIDIRLGPQKAQSEMVIGLVQAIDEFTNQFTSDTKRRINQIDHGTSKVLIEYGKYTGCAVLCQSDSPWIRARMIYLLVKFEEQFDQLLIDPSDISPFQIFHGTILDVIPHDILTKEDFELPVYHGLHEVPIYEGSQIESNGREEILLRLADGTRSIRDIAAIDNTPFLTILSEYRQLKSKGVKILRKMI